LIGADPVVGTVAAHYAYSLTATGGNGRYHYAITAGELPPGIKLMGKTLKGIPTTAGDYTVSITVTDTEKPPQSAMATASIDIDPGQPTVTLKAPTKVKYGANLTLTAVIRGLAKGQPDTGAVTFSGNGDDLSAFGCGVRVIDSTGEIARCTINSSVLGPVGGPYPVEVAVGSDGNYNAASAAGQVTSFK
jgi:hypothetical protein